ARTGRRGPADRGGEPGRRVSRDLHQRLARRDPDRADRVAGDVAAVAQERDEPARIGLVDTSEPDAKPHRFAAPARWGAAWRAHAPVAGAAAVVAARRPRRRLADRP